MSSKRDADPSERYYPVSAVARWLGVTEVSIKNWTNAGKLTAIRTAGGHRRITAGSVVAMLEAQGRSVPRELADARPVVLVVMQTRDELVKHLRRVLGTGTRVEIESDGYVAAMTAVRVRPIVVVLDVTLPHFDSVRWMAAMRGDRTLRSVTALLVGDGSRGRTVPSSNEGEGPTHFFQRREHEAIAAAAGALVKQLATQPASDRHGRRLFRGDDHARRISRAERSNDHSSSACASSDPSGGGSEVRDCASRARSALVLRVATPPLRPASRACSLVQ